MFSGINLAGKFQVFKDFIEGLYGTLFGYGDDLVRNTQDLAGSNEPYLLQIREAIGYLPEGNSLRTYLIQLLSNGLVTDTTNLETLRREIVLTTGSAEDEYYSNLGRIDNLLQGLRGQVSGPTSPTIAQLLVDQNERLETIINKMQTAEDNMNILIEEVSTIRILTLFPASGPNIMALTSSIAECICRLADELAPVNPGPTIPDLTGHPCADGGTPLMVIYPTDWVEIANFGWAATPSYIAPSLAGAYYVEMVSTNVPGEPDIPMVRFDRGAPNYEPELLCTVVDSPDLVAVVRKTGWYIDEGPPAGWALAGLSQEVTNVGLAAGGCEALALGNIEGFFDGFVFEVDDPAVILPPTFTIVLYSLPA